jgi:hypothetical protein
VSFVSDTACVHRIPPRVNDDRDTPLMWDETVTDIEVIWVRRQALFRKFRIQSVCLEGIGSRTKMTRMGGVPANRALKRANSGDRIRKAKAIDR